MNITSPLLSRMLLALRSGLSFRGARDYYEVYGYKRALTAEDFLGKYQRQDIAGRVVDTPPEGTWAFPPTIVDNDAVAAVWQELVDRQIVPAIQQADKLCAFGQFSILMIGMPGTLTSPAPKVTLDKISYFTAYGTMSVKVKEFETNRASERFGLPTMYTVSSEEDKSTGAVRQNFDLHWTRAVHITDIPIQGRLYSAPRMERVFNLLDDILKVAGASAETYWLAANRGLQVDVDKEMTFEPADAEKLTEELEEYQHQLRRFIRTRGVKINNLGSDVSDPSGSFTALMSLLASATSIPQRILMGAEAGQLASAQDRANWAEYLERRRTNMAEPYILRPIFRHLELIGVLSAGQSRKIKFEWPPAFRQNPLEASQTMSAKARALINLSRQSQYGTPYVGHKEGRIWLGLSPELAPDDYFPIVKGAATDGNTKQGQTEKQGGSKESGGAGGNDGTGDSGGGGSDDNNAPSGDTVSDAGTN